MKTSSESLREHWTTAPAKLVDRWRDTFANPGEMIGADARGHGVAVGVASTVEEIVAAGYRVDRTDVPTRVHDMIARESDPVRSSRLRVQNSEDYADEQRAISKIEGLAARGWMKQTRVQEAERSRAEEAERKRDEERRIQARAAELMAADAQQRAARFVEIARAEVARARDGRAS